MEKSVFASLIIVRARQELQKCFLSRDNLLSFCRCQDVPFEFTRLIFMFFYEALEKAFVDSETDFV